MEPGVFSFSPHPSLSRTKGLGGLIPSNATPSVFLLFFLSVKISTFLEERRDGERKFIVPDRGLRYVRTRFTQSKVGAPRESEPSSVQLVQ